METVRVNVGTGSLAFVLWLIFFWHEPDLLDALISPLMAVS